MCAAVDSAYVSLYAENVAAAHLRALQGTALHNISHLSLQDKLPGGSSQSG